MAKKRKRNRNKGRSYWIPKIDAPPKPPTRTLYLKKGAEAEEVRQQIYIGPISDNDDTPPGSIDLESTNMRKVGGRIVVYVRGNYHFFVEARDQSEPGGTLILTVESEPVTVG